MTELPFNGKTERIRAYGGIILSVMIIFAIVFLLIQPDTGDVGNVVAGALAVSLKDAVGLFDRAALTPIVEKKE